MSSHHFVKEGQEPALLICEHADHLTIDPLLEWSPLVMVFEDVLEELVSWGIKIDVVITGSARVESLKRSLSEHLPIRILNYPRKEDQLQIAFDFLRSERQRDVTVVARRSSEIFDRLQDHAGTLNVTLITPGVKWSLIGGGSFNKWLPAGSELSVHTRTQVYLPDGRVLQGSTFHADADALYTLRGDEPFWIGEVL